MLRSFAVDGYEIHDLTDVNPSSWVTPDGLDGFGQISLRVNTYDNPGEDGGTVSNILLSKRLLTIPGVVTGVDELAYMTNRRAFELACSVLRDGVGRPVPRLITFTTQDERHYFVYGHVQALNVLSQYNAWAVFQLQITCPDPQFFLAGQVTSGQIARPTGSGVTWPWSWPVNWGATTGGVVTVNNSGNAYTWPLVTFRGPATNPSVVHQESGTVMQLNTTLVAGDVVVVDMQAHTVVLNGTANLFGAATDDSDWFSIAPGNNTLTFSTGSTSDTGTVEVTFYSAVLAI